MCSAPPPHRPHIGPTSAPRLPCAVPHIGPTAAVCNAPHRPLPSTTLPYSVYVCRRLIVCLQSDRCAQIHVSRPVGEVTSGCMYGGVNITLIYSFFLSFVLSLSLSLSLFSLSFFLSFFLLSFLSCFLSFFLSPPSLSLSLYPCPPRSLSIPPLLLPSLSLSFPSLSLYLAVPGLLGSIPAPTRSCSSLRAVLVRILIAICTQCMYDSSNLYV